MAYTLRIDKRVEKEVRALPGDVRERVLSALARLQESPLTGSVKKLVGEPSYRLRIGNYRIVFEVDTFNKEVTVLKVAHRKDVYRR